MMTQKRIRSDDTYNLRPLNKPRTNEVDQETHLRTMDSLNYAIKNKSKERYLSIFENSRRNRYDKWFILLYSLYRVSDNMLNPYYPYDNGDSIEFGQFITCTFSNRDITESDIMNIIHTIGNFLTWEEYTLSHEYIRVLNNNTLKCIIDYIHLNNIDHLNNIVHSNEQTLNYITEISLVTLR